MDRELRARSETSVVGPGGSTTPVAAVSPRVRPVPAPMASSSTSPAAADAPDPATTHTPRAANADEFQPITPDLAIAPAVSVVVPTLNEAANIPYVFETIPDWVHEVILVDGHSTDGTVAVAQRLRPDVRVIHQDGTGKGAAMAAGCTAATGGIIVLIDADGSTDGSEMQTFVSALAAGADFAKGSRFAHGGGSSDITWPRRLGNRMLDLLVNRIYGTHFTDLCYGYNAFWAKHRDAIVADWEGFEVETLMNLRAAKAGLRIQEIPSHERSRIHGTSNLQVLRDGWRVLKVIVKERPRHVRLAGQGDS
jgi:glycosyltransferase involved in cell wall biosynthesis